MYEFDTSFLFDASIKAFDAGDRSIGSVYTAYGDVCGNQKKTRAFLASLRVAAKDSPQLYPEMIGVAQAVVQNQPALIPEAFFLMTEVIKADPIYATPGLVKQVVAVRDQAAPHSPVEKTAVYLLEAIRKQAPECDIPGQSILTRFRKAAITPIGRTIYYCPTFQDAINLKEYPNAIRLLQKMEPQQRADVTKSAPFRGVDLKGENLIWADLRNANLRGINFSNACLRGAKLSGADLTEADLSNTNLSAADDFRGTKLTGANLRGADLIWADLTGAVGLTAGQVWSATNCQKATFDPELTSEFDLPVRNKGAATASWQWKHNRHS